MKSYNKKIRYLLLIFLLCGFIPLELKAQVIHNVSTDGRLVIPGNSSYDYIITGTTSGDNANTVTIQRGYKGTITLRNLSINSSRPKPSTNDYSSDNVSCITVLGDEYNKGNNRNPNTIVNIILEGQNKLDCNTAGHCAIQVDQGAQIMLSSIDPNDNSKGVLTATTVSGGAAIGAVRFQNLAAGGQGQSVIYYNDGSLYDNGNPKSTAGGNIIISSGTITANAHSHGAGIGGGWYAYYDGIIIIYGGVVVATTGTHGAAIGSGCPRGTGVVQEFAPNSAIIALPPASISAQGNDGSLAGARNITYINDPSKTEITVHTEDYEPDADIYLDLTQTDGLVDIFTELNIDYDLKKVRVGKTDTSGLLKFRAQLERSTTFFTDASSTQPATLGRPYLPVETTVIGNYPATRDIELPLLDTEISFTDYPSTPLEVGYTEAEARANAFMVKLEFKDPVYMDNVTFELQGGTDPFGNMIFLAADGVTQLLEAPKRLNSGDIYYIVLPVNQGKPVGIYSDILLITGEWNGTPLPGYIRRVGMQRVITDDTGKNNHIKVTATPNKFVQVHPATETVSLTLNIDHTGTNVTYDPLDVTAKYIITTKANYEDAVAESPVSSWSNMTIPTNNAQDAVTTVSFNSLPVGTYYIHWNVVSGVIYAQSENVTDPPKTYGGFGSYVIYNEIIVGEIKGNPFVCKGSEPQEIKGEASTGGSGSLTYQWQISTNGTTWTDIAVNATAQNYSPAAITTDTYYRRATIDSVHGVTEYSNTFMIKVVDPGITLYWNRNPADNNWNNPANWMDVNGNALNLIPLACTNVYLTGGATRYPSLNPDLTDTDIYGLPVCQNITFAYGSELMYQQRLTYEKAHVQYNFGYYNSTSGGTLRSFDSYNSPSMLSRDMWYPLAAPLKKMASGDFALAGYPFTWQAKHETDNMTNGLGIVNTNSFETNDVDLTKAYHAIAIKVAAYHSSKTGYKDQKYLESLKGVIEIPYFENKEADQYRPGHSYDPIAGKSTFLYYNTNTLQTVYSPVGEMKRSDEAYRFVYENEDNSVPTISALGVPGYTINVTASSGNKVLIGNPLLAKISAMKFYQANQHAIEEADGYMVYDEATKAWKTMSYGSYSNSINSFESFIVTLKSSSATLYFPMEGNYALTDPALVPTRSSISPGSSITVTAKDLDGNGEEAYLASQYSNATRSVEKLVSSSELAAPEVFFVDNNQYNLLQLYSGETSEIRLGVKTSQTGMQVSLTFDNVKDFMADNNISTILLVDKATGKTQDLAENSTYNFVHSGNIMDGQYVDTERISLKFGATGIDTSNPDGANIYYQNNAICIEGIDVNYVNVFDVAGNKVLELGKSDINYVALSQGVYIVKVYGTDGLQKTARIVVK